MAGHQRARAVAVGGKDQRIEETHSEESNGVDGQLVNVRITHDGGRIGADFGGAEGEKCEE
jgi:hypothetical protein